ncbi:MAG: DegV family protein [Lachnospiraceae bacterium]|nr:DegV family protein [Lachnospiraceae bacterium]
MIKFIADSSGDMTAYKGVNFETVALKIDTDRFSYTDDKDINIPEMLNALEKYKGRSYSACPSTECWLQAYAGGDEIYVVTMTSELSGTYNSAMVAKKMYLEKNPDAKIEIFDTLSTGPEIRLVIEKLVELKQKGWDFDRVCKEVKEYMGKTRLFFSFLSIHNLAQNGRVSKIIASAVGVLGISIIGTASTRGKIEPITKCRGDRKVISKLLEELKKAGYAGGKLRISHIENSKLARRVIEAVKETYGNADAIMYEARGLCSYYGERGGIIIGCECTKSFA